MFDVKFISANDSVDLKKGDHLRLISDDIPSANGKGFQEVEIVGIYIEVRQLDAAPVIVFEVSTPYGSNHFMYLPFLLLGMRKYQQRVEIESGKRAFYLGELPQEDWSKGKCEGWNLAGELAYAMAMLFDVDTQF